MSTYDITVSRGTKGFGLSLIYRGLDKFPAPETGIYVARVVQGGNSHRAGLQENDKIIKIDKRTPRDVNDAVNIIKKAGKQLLVTVARKQPDVINQDEPLGQYNQDPAPLSRSGSVRSINTQFAGASRPQTPVTDSSGDEREDRNQARNQQLQALYQQQQYEKEEYEQQQLEQQQQQQLAQQQQQQMLLAQQQKQQQHLAQQKQIGLLAQQRALLQQQQQQKQQYEQQQRMLLEQEREQEKAQYEEQLDRERAAIAEENRRLQAQQQELQRQREEWNRQQEQYRIQQEELKAHKLSAKKMMSHQDLVASLVNSRDPISDLPPRRPVHHPPPNYGQNEDSSGDEEFVRSRRTKSVGARTSGRAKSPGGLSTRSGISFHDLSDLSATSRMSRMEEKVNMQGLNNRLAGYIDKVRQLQKENSKMVRQVEYIETSQMKELNTIKSMYIGEVNELKRAITDLSHNYRDLQTTSDKVLQTNRDLKSQVNKKSSDVKIRNDSVHKMKEELSRLRNKMSAAEKERDRVGEKLNEVLPEVDKIKQKISETQFQLGDVRKVNQGLELETKRLHVELKDKMNMMDTKLNEVKIRKQVEISELSGKLVREYEDRVQRALAGLREVYENQMQEGKTEFSKKYEKKVSDLQSLLSKERYKNNSTGQGLEETNRRITALLSKVKNLETERVNLSMKLENLETNLQDDQIIHKKQLNAKDDEMRRLMAEIHKQMEEYQNLMNTKTALDMEIAVYRKLVESEEDRMGIDIRDDASQSLFSSRECSTPSSPKANRYTTYKNTESSETKQYGVSQTQL